MKFLGKFLAALQNKPSLRELLRRLHLHTADSFYVYDGGQALLGNNFSVKKDKPEDGVSVYAVSGSHYRRPNDGDRVVLKSNQGTAGLFILYNVNAAHAPDERFTAQAVRIANDYKGGFGHKGAAESSGADSLRVIQSMKE